MNLASVRAYDGVAVLLSARVITAVPPTAMRVCLQLRCRAAMEAANR